MNLKIKHSSQPNNPDIANCFFRAGLIEAWGRGTIRIISECKDAKAPTPVFRNDYTEFWVEFKFKKQVVDAVETIAGTNSNVDKVLEAIALNESITVDDLVIKIGVSVRTIKRILKELQETNQIVREGSKKVGVWKIVENK